MILNLLKLLIITLAAEHGKMDNVPNVHKVIYLIIMEFVVKLINIVNNSTEM